MSVSICELNYFCVVAKLWSKYIAAQRYIYI